MTSEKEWRYRYSLNMLIFYIHSKTANQYETKQHLKKFIYLSQGARPLNDWTTYRVEGEALTALAK